MTQFPGGIDSDIDIPPIFDNLSEIGDEVVNAIRSATFAVESNLGINAQGSLASVSDRLNVSFNADGTIRASALTGIGLISLPIRNNQIASDAAIDESKLNLTFSTQSLHDLFANLNNEISVLNDFVSTAGSEILPHIAGSAFNHLLSAIKVDAGSLNRVNLASGGFGSRDLTNSYNLVSQISNDLLNHTQADGISNTTTPPANMAHSAVGLYIDPTHFTSVPETANNLQAFAEYVDSSSLALLGSRTQNLYSNGIPRASRATSLVNTSAGEAVVDPTPATSYLLHSSAVNPVDNIDHGDNIILLTPNPGVLSNNTFDAQFSQVKPGDYITVIYSNDIVPVTFTIDSVKKFLNGTNRVYTVRINGKNLLETTAAIVRIDRPFYHESKFNSLAVAAANNTFAITPSLIIGSARGATALGIGFNLDQLDSSHFNLYLALYPTGNPLQRAIFLPAIDITGDNGKSPGKYTIDSIVSSINNQLRQPGYNYRFIAFSYQGSIGITLADHYDDASFSIIAGVVDTNGQYTGTSNASYPGNIVDNFNGFDALGLGFGGSNVASPPFAASYGSASAALNAPTQIFAPTRKNFFYVDGVEKDSFDLEELTTRDGYGDGYWNATLTIRNPLSNRVEVTYEVDLDLSSSNLKAGKTLVVQPSVSYGSGSYNPTDYGRFVISNVAFANCPGPSPVTTITVYDGIHGTGFSPFSSSAAPLPVKLYFTDDSVSFDGEQISDSSTNMTFKRLFETYLDTNGKASSHERARFNTAGTNLIVDSINGFILYSNIELAQMNITNVSPKLKGYTFGQYSKITFFINSYDAPTGVFNGFLCKYQSPSTYSNQGPTITGKKGDVVRFYDETTVDYIDITFNLNDTISSFVLKQIDIQLYPSLELNQEKILLSKCQLADSTNSVSNIKDARQFGNVSEKQFSTSALDYIAANDRAVAGNGVVRGFDIAASSGGTISIRGGSALIDGKIVDFNATTLSLPAVFETLYPNFIFNIPNIKWYLCANKKGDFEFVASTDYDLSLSSNYGSLDHNRLFYVKNPNATAILPYSIRSSYLQKIMSSISDLVPLYIINGNTISNGSSFVSSISSTLDIRRFIEKGYSGFGTPFVLSSVGSYRSIDSVSNTLLELTNNISYSLTKQNVFGSTIYVRDSFDISAKTLDFPVHTKFVGDNGKFIISFSPVNVNKNISFSNLDISVATDFGFKLNGQDITFDNCNIDYNYDATSDLNFTAANLANVNKACIYMTTSSVLFPSKGKNIKIKDCHFTSLTANRFPFVGFSIANEDQYLQNIIIDNNIIDTLYTSDLEDKRAVIFASCTLTDTPTAPLGPRLVDCQISNNVCNKNQLILISGSPNGNNQMPNMISPVNVIIEKNVCGAICYLTRQDRSYRIGNIINVNDKDNSLIISQNNCRLIYCGTNFGFINISGSANRIVYDIISGSDIYSSAATIIKNTCSWIQVGVKNPTNYNFESPVIQIEGNRLTAYDATYLNDYYVLQTPLDIGLVVDSLQGT